MLLRLLKACGVGVPFEYFQPHFASLLVDRYGTVTLEEYVTCLIRRRSRNNVFAAKLEWAWMSGLADVHHLLFSPSCLWVMIIRESLLDQSVSLYCSQLTGTFGPGEPPPPIDAPSQAGLLAAIEHVANEETLFRRFFARNGIEPLLVTYEGLLEEPEAVVRSIATTLKVAICDQALHAAMAAERRYSKPSGLLEQIRGLLPV
jgi:LPS sulfotransferase NodH